MLTASLPVYKQAGADKPVPAAYRVADNRAADKPAAQAGDRPAERVSAERAEQVAAEADTAVQAERSALPEAEFHSSHKIFRHC